MKEGGVSRSRSRKTKARLRRPQGNNLKHRQRSLLQVLWCSLSPSRWIANSLEVSDHRLCWIQGQSFRLTPLKLLAGIVLTKAVCHQASVLISVVYSLSKGLICNRSWTMLKGFPVVLVPSQLTASAIMSPMAIWSHVTMKHAYSSGSTFLVSVSHKSL